MQKTQFLPLGSVVSLKNATKRIMIAGRLQQDGVSGKNYEYAAVLYPEGFIRSDSVYLFNEEDIERVWFVGMQDDEEFAFRTVLDEHAAKKDIQHDM